jgi:hypothetical protein
MDVAAVTPPTHAQCGTTVRGATHVMCWQTYGIQKSALGSVCMYMYIHTQYVDSLELSASQSCRLHPTGYSLPVQGRSDPKQDG